MLFASTRSICAACAVAACFTTVAIGDQTDDPPTSPAPPAPAETTRVATFDIDDGEQSVTIHIKNGKIEVLRDGEPVDVEQIEQREGVWRFLNDEGEVQARFFMLPRGEVAHAKGEQEPGVFRLRLKEEDDGEAARLLRRALMPDPPAPPRPGEAEGARRAMLGVMLEPVDEALARHLEVDPQKAVVVSGVVPGSGAAEAGVREHDIIVRIADFDTADTETIRRVVRRKAPGEAVRVVLLRKGERVPLTVRLKPAQDEDDEPQTIQFRFRADERPDAPRRGGVVERRREQEEEVVERRQESMRARQRAMDERERVLRERLDAMQRQRDHMHARGVDDDDEQTDEEAHAFRLEFEGDLEKGLIEGLDALRQMRIDIDENTRKEIAEAMERAREALEEVEIDFQAPRMEILGGADGRVLFLPDQPDARTFNRVFRVGPEGEDRVRLRERAGDGDRLARLEERLARLEERLMRIERALLGSRENHDN